MCDYLLPKDARHRRASKLDILPASCADRRPAPLTLCQLEGLSKPVCSQQQHIKQLKSCDSHTSHGPRSVRVWCGAVAPDDAKDLHVWYLADTTQPVVWKELNLLTTGDFIGFSCSNRENFLQQKLAWSDVRSIRSFPSDLHARNPRSMQNIGRAKVASTSAVGSGIETVNACSDADAP